MIVSTVRKQAEQSEPRLREGELKREIHNDEEGEKDEDENCC